MRPVYVSLSATGNTPWVPIDYLQTAFAIGIGVWLTSGATLTYSVQHTFDSVDIGGQRTISISRTTTTATVTDPGHGLSVNDSVIISGSGSAVLDSQKDAAGRPIPWDVASIVDANTYTYTVANSGASASVPGNTFGQNFRIFNHASLAALTARADGNYAFPPLAVRLKCTAYSSGTVTMGVIQGKGH